MANHNALAAGIYVRDVVGSLVRDHVVAGVSAWVGSFQLALLRVAILHVGDLCGRQVDMLVVQIAFSSFRLNAPCVVAHASR